MNSSKTHGDTKHRASSFSTHLFASLLIFLLAMAFFFPILFGNTYTTIAGHHSAVYPWLAFNPQFRDYPQSDQADLTHPWRVFTKETLRKGAFPFWNPHIFAGEPFFTNGSSAVIYPPQFLANLFLPPDWAHDIISFIHVFASGLFMYLLLREFRAGFAGALFSAVAWMFSSFNLAWLHLEVVAPISMFLPLSVWLVARAFRHSSWACSLGATAALGTVFVSGHLLFCGLVYGIAIAYALILAIGGCRSIPLSMTPVQRTKHIQGMLLRLALIIIGPAALSAVVLWPTILGLRALGRESLPYHLVHDSIRVPYSVFWSVFKAPELPVSESVMHRMLFAGTLTAVFAFIGIFRRVRGAMFARILILAVFLVATDTLLLKAVYAILPQFSFFSPLGRLLNLFAFGLALLGGLGMDAVASRFQNRGIVQGLLGLAILLTAIQLLYYGRSLNPPFVPREAQNLYPETPLIRALKKTNAATTTTPGRILPLRASPRSRWTAPILYANEAMVFGIDSIGGYDSTSPARSETLWRIISGQDPQEVLKMKYRRAFVSSFESDRVRFNLLPKVGVTLLVTPPATEMESQWRSEDSAPLQLEWRYSGPDGQVFAIKNASGGPWLVHHADNAANSAAALERFLEADFDVTRGVVLEAQDADKLHLSNGSLPAATDAVHVRENGVNSLRYQVTSSGAGWLVIPNSWDAGWQATVNGQKANVLKANYAFQAVAVPQGITEVQLRYRPCGFLPGAVLSVLTFLALSIGGIHLRRSRSLNCGTQWICAKFYGL
jgi:hypothetical protein